jgi:RIO kinase 1
LPDNNLNNNLIADEFSDKWDAYGDEDPPRVRKVRRTATEKPVVELAEPGDEEAGFQTTYQPGRFERVWLLSSLRAFYDQNLLTDVLAHVKGGKEASVYRCAAHPNTGLELAAAKVYRPRNLRNLRNDKMYQEGRPILTSEGRVVKATDDRLLRAVGKKTQFGVQVAHTSWLMYEYTTLEQLYNAGAAVPRPIGASDNAILMGYQGDRERSAPTLSEVTLEPDEAHALFAETLRNISLMLRFDRIHGDLSAYNILYWNGQITLIDFPQVTHSRANTQAEFILQRDITRVCDYFARQGVSCDPAAIMADLWRRHIED